MHGLPADRLLRDSELHLVQSTARAAPAERLPSAHGIGRCSTYASERLAARFTAACTGTEANGAKYLSVRAHSTSQVLAADFRCWNTGAWQRAPGSAPL
jgi:hypothetical protein